MYIFFDSETRANDKAEDYYARKVYEAPSNYVDPVKIAKVIEEKRAADRETAGLKWWTGSVCCISATTSEGESFSTCGPDEKTILLAFSTWCQKQEAAGQVHYVAKNGSDFDRPFLIGRFMALRIPMPFQFSGRAEKHSLKDLDSIWGWGRHGQMGKLSDYAHGLGLEQKLADGAAVQGMFDRQEFLEIEAYCRHDTALVAQIVNIWLEVTQ